MNTELARRSPAPLPEASFEAMKRQAVVLSKTELVPKALQGKPEALMLIGLWGAEHGVPFATAVQDVHIIENRPSPSAQLRLALIRRAGHEIRFTETSSERAVLRARRREYRNDPDAWVTVTYTLDDARKAELLDQWVEKWMAAPGDDRKKKNIWKVGDDTGPANLDGAPAWVGEELQAGRVHSKDNWRKYPADMLRARAAGVMSRMEFSDVMAALDIVDYTAEELGVDAGQDLDEPATPEAGPVATSEDGEGEVIEEAVLVEELAPEPEPTAPPAEPQTAPVPGETPAADPADNTLQGGTSSHDRAGRPQDTPEPETPVPGPGMPEPRDKERPDITLLKQRIRQGMTPVGWDKLVSWLEACNVAPDLDRITHSRVDAINAELDLRGVARLQPETGG